MITQLVCVNLVATRIKRQTWRITIKEDFNATPKKGDFWLGTIMAGGLSEFQIVDNTISIEFLSEIVTLGSIITRLELEESRSNR